MSRRYRFPRPSEYGTALAVSIKACPVCGFSYRKLKTPMFITTDLGEVVLTYKVGQLICDWCLTRNLRTMHLQAHIA
jgi:hypothetical protein